MSKKKNSSPIFIQFDHELKRAILNGLGKTVNENGEVIDGKGENVLSVRGELLSEDQLGCVIKGSELYLQKDIDSILRFLESKDA